MGTIKKKMMKNDKNGQLSCGIYSSPAAARCPLQGWVGDRCRDRSITLISTFSKFSVTPLFAITIKKTYRRDKKAVINRENSILRGRIYYLLEYIFCSGGDRSILLGINNKHPIMLNNLFKSEF